jgi:hypothetical protein
MPVIARRAKAAHARFYWHLGDLRALYKIDEDYAGLHRGSPNVKDLKAYQKAAWDDFSQQQVAPFGRIPFFLGIGNHEIIGNTRQDFVTHFAKLLDIEPIRRQRLADDPNDNTVRSYYHFYEQGVDFLYLDNADSTFDQDQLAWALNRIAAAQSNKQVKILMVGMHESLPDSYTADHSMNQGGDKGESGRILYNRLLEFHQETGKPVHIFSSHSHYYLSNIYNTAALQSLGPVLPGWLVGTAGAQHYSVPPEVKSFTTWAENEYGYATVRVDPGAGSVSVKFVPIKRRDLDRNVNWKFGRSTVDFCFSENWSASLHADPY